MLDQSLRVDVERLVGHGRIDSAFVAVTGPRPGTEALAVPATVLGAPLWWIDTALAGIAAAIIVVSTYVFVVWRRSLFTIALVDDAIVICSNSYLAWRTPTGVVKSVPLPTNVTVPDRAGGDKHIIIADQRYWLYERDVDEARRMAKRIRARPDGQSPPPPD